AGLRLNWRRRRLRAGRRGNPDALWDELIATATDLGYVWSNARTPRQVANWLGVDIGQKSAGAMAALADAVEQSRYAPEGAGLDIDLVPALHRVEAELRLRRSNATRFRSRLLPRSVTRRSRSTRRH
ncbi:MAG: transglutaminase, partial [Actinomycetota bacterium]|nr:transglutaminase [Actinomycetota bacterium]